MMQAALDILYPGQCVSCRNTVASAQGVCPSCWGETPFIDGTICDACGTPLLGEAEGRVWHCDDCIATPRPWDKGRSSLVYKGLARRIVLNLKHGDRQDTAAPLAKWMARAAKGLVPEKGLVAPVPLHWMRMIKRGFNQSAALAHPLAQELGLGFCPDLLQRIRRTASLDGTSRPARFEMLKGAISVHPRRKHRLAGREVLLVDDVMTTGATLEECTRACLSAGAARVCVVTLARAAKDT